MFFTKGILTREDESYVVTEYELAKEYEKDVYLVFLDQVSVKDAQFDRAEFALALRRIQGINAGKKSVNEVCNEIFRKLGIQPVQVNTPIETVQKKDAPVVKKVREAVTESKYADLKTGEYLTFGTYPQGKNGEEAPIEWKVLKREGNKALLISKYCLEAKEYNEECEDTTWAECTLRTWLNNGFLNKAFTAEEQRVILEEKHHTEDSKYGPEGGEDTEDKVFLLSVKEAKELFGNNEIRKGYATEYAKGQEAYVDDYAGGSWWWLRSPGSDRRFAACVIGGGSVLEGGRYVNGDGVRVRPAIWINL